MVAATHYQPSDEDERRAKKFFDNLYDPAFGLDDPDSEMDESDPIYQAGMRVVESRIGHIWRRRRRVKFALIATAVATIAALGSYSIYLRWTPSGIASRIVQPPPDPMDVSREHVEAGRNVDAIETLRDVDTADAHAVIGFCQLRMADANLPLHAKFRHANDAIASFEQAIAKGYPRPLLNDNIGCCRRISCITRARQFDRVSESELLLEMDEVVKRLFSEYFSLVHTKLESRPRLDLVNHAVKQWPSNRELHWVAAQLYAISAARTDNSEHLTCSLEHLWAAMGMSGKWSHASFLVGDWNPDIKSHPEFVALLGRDGQLSRHNPFGHQAVRIASKSR